MHPDALDQVTIGIADLTRWQAFYDQALAFHAAPGLRAPCHRNYCGAFVLDPDGHNIEAVCHRSAA
ncbi:MAG TPA: hypothetical protein VHS58_01080 [Acetobacteraceae bacterium]|jgi:hypothetical protein|nr:hypothetical protein [Acetobacteraceae bacterium]